MMSEQWASEVCAEVLHRGVVVGHADVVQFVFTCNMISAQLQHNARGLALVCVTNYGTTDQ